MEHRTSFIYNLVKQRKKEDNCQILTINNNIFKIKKTKKTIL